MRRKRMGSTLQATGDATNAVDLEADAPPFDTPDIDAPAGGAPGMRIGSWWTCLGGTAAYLLIIQFITGILLALFYKGTDQGAHDSVRQITTDLPLGWYLRGIHKWGATLMLVAIILHQSRIYFAAAFRHPRELNWMIGVCLLLATIGTTISGYALVSDQPHYQGAAVVANVCGNIPVLGNSLKQCLLAGDHYNEHTLSRFLLLHAVVLPGISLALVAAHIALMRMQGAKDNREQRGNLPVKGRCEPQADRMLSEILVGLVLMIVLSGLVTVFPPGVGIRGHFSDTPALIAHAENMVWTQRWLGLFAGTFVVLGIGFILCMMLFWPWLDRGLRRLSGNEKISHYIGFAATLIAIALSALSWLTGL